MANTYTQLYIQLVFAVYKRKCLIHPTFRERVEKYICGIISQEKCKPLAIYCNPDHTHVLVGIHPAVSVSNLAKIIKSKSSKFINEQKLLSCHFQWQTGFGAFSYSQSHKQTVINYVLNQSRHHKKYNFREEYFTFLGRFDVDFDERYLFEFLD